MLGSFGVDMALGTCQPDPGSHTDGSVKRIIQKGRKLPGTGIATVFHLWFEGPEIGVDRFIGCINCNIVILVAVSRVDHGGLIQIVDGDRGVNYPKKVDFNDKGFCLFLNTKNVRPDGFNFDTTMFITEEKDKALRKGKLKRRDVILTTRGTIGNIAVYDNSIVYDEIRINSGMLIFRPNEKVILSEYLFEILRSGIMKSQTERFVSGAAQPQLPIKTLVNFTVPVPVELADQKRIVARLKNLSDETKHLEAIYQQKLDSLAELKQSILQKTFAGELTTLPEKTLAEAVA